VATSGTRSLRAGVSRAGGGLHLQVEAVTEEVAVVAGLPQRRAELAGAEEGGERPVREGAREAEQPARVRGGERLRRQPRRAGRLRLARLRYQAAERGVAGRILCEQRQPRGGRAGGSGSEGEDGAEQRPETVRAAGLLEPRGARERVDVGQRESRVAQGGGAADEGGGAAGGAQVGEVAGAAERQRRRHR
jgi:hypothetical protein